MGIEVVGFGTKGTYKKAIYPGSFNPWTVGHEDVLKQALRIFEHVTIARGINPSKLKSSKELQSLETGFWAEMKSVQDHYLDRISLRVFNTLLVQEAHLFGDHAVVRGLRNEEDFDHEKIQKYYNEDLGLHVPFVYFIADRTVAHISSTGMRAIQEFGK